MGMSRKPGFIIYFIVCSQLLDFDLLKHKYYIRISYSPILRFGKSKQC